MHHLSQLFIATLVCLACPLALPFLEAARELLRLYPMLISAFVVTVRSDQKPEVVAAALCQDQRITVGAPQGRLLPVTAETLDENGGYELCEQLALLAAVERVDVVEITHVDQDQEPAPC